jgi:hypothetical protein
MRQSVNVPFLTSQKLGRVGCCDGIDDLVFDVGMHLGEDSAYYLAKGYRVVAVEANPELADAGRRRFDREISAGRLTIVEGAIADTDRPTITFYRHPTESVWGTADPDWAGRNAHMGESESIVGVHGVSGGGVGLLL